MMMACQLVALNRCFHCRKIAHVLYCLIKISGFLFACLFVCFSIKNKRRSKLKLVFDLVWERRVNFVSRSVFSLFNFVEEMLTRNRWCNFLLTWNNYTGVGLVSALAQLTGVNTDVHPITYHKRLHGLVITSFKLISTAKICSAKNYCIY